MSDRLNALFDEFGQSPWLDNLKRSYITSGLLAATRDSGIRGLTSNPTIFQKAIQGSDDYSEQFLTLKKQKLSAIEIYWQLVLRDIHGALDVFQPLYESSDGLDGFVSVEVDPNLAHDCASTLASARDLHQTISRPNVMIKIPATLECIPAIATMIAEARSVNVTLIFSLDRYQQVMNAYIDGLEQLANTQPNKINSVSSVASFFISRVDTEIDKLLVESGRTGASLLLGTAAINQAKLAYEMFKTTFSGQRWHRLERLGAKVQRPLWASTSTKNPSYSDTVYVDSLIGENTVNTLPDSTVEAFIDHGNLKSTIESGLDRAHDQWHLLSNFGIDVAAVATKLERDGVSSFRASFDELIGVLTNKVSGNF